MAGRDDFGSGARSPGGWGGQGNMRTAAGGGGHGSLGGAAGRNGSGMGGLGGVGGGVGSIRPEAMAYAVREGKWPGGYATPYIKKPVPPPTGLPVENPIVAALARRLLPPSIPSVPEEIIPGYQPPRYINPGAGVDPNGIGRTYSNRTVPVGHATSNPPIYSPSGSYTNANAPVGGFNAINPPKYSPGLPGGQATAVNPRTGGAKWP